MNLEEFEDDFKQIERRPRGGAPGQQSPAARQVAEWFRQLSRLVRIARTYGPYAPLARQSRERLVQDLLPLLEYHAPLVLRLTSLEIWLRDELLMRAQPDDEGGPSLEHQLPFILYRDGLRGMTIGAETTREEVAAFVSAVLEVTTSSLTHDDLCTLLWAANLPHVEVDSAALELEPPIESSSPVEIESVLPNEPTRESWIDKDPFANVVRIPEPRTSPRIGLAGPHQDDWLLRDCAASAASLWREKHIHEEPAAKDFLEEWRSEDAVGWSKQVEGFISEVVRLEPRADMRQSLSDSVMTWFASAVQRCDWIEAQKAYDVVRTLDADPSRAEAMMRDALAGLDHEAITSQLDEASPEEQARFFALMVTAGLGALDLTVSVLGRAGRARLRAAATTALSYLCHDEPTRLAPYLADSRWHVVRNVAFVLGQIGGPQTTPLLARAARHLDARVRRTAVVALAQVPERERVPLLLEHLDTHDPQLLNNTLSMLTRERSTQVALSLLGRINADDFETRSDEHKLALISALADVADDGAVPALEQLLLKGGWFARRTAERTAAARTLGRIGTTAALQVLEEGCRSRAEAVRAACLEALQMKVRP